MYYLLLLFAVYGYNIKLYFSDYGISYIYTINKYYLGTTYISIIIIIQIGFHGSYLHNNTFYNEFKLISSITYLD